MEAPFAPGKTIKGKLTYPGYEKTPWKIVVQKIEPKTLFSFTWHPFAIDLMKDYSKVTDLGRIQTEKFR